MQNEQRLDNTENKVTSETDGDTDKIKEKAENNLSKNTTINNSILVNGSSKKDEDNANHKESSETAPSDTPKKTIEESQSAGDEDQAKDEGNEDMNNESKENNEENEEIDSHEDNENTENQATQEAEQPHTETTATDEIEQKTSTNTIPPPKPPRLKSGNAEDANNEKESSKENDRAEEIEKEKDEEEMKTNEERSDSAKSSGGKPKSVISKSGDEHTIDDVENSIDNMEEDGHKEKMEMDGAQDDADVIQSPAPRTGW